MLKSFNPRQLLTEVLAHFLFLILPSQQQEVYGYYISLLSVRIFFWPWQLKAKYLWKIFDSMLNILDVSIILDPNKMKWKQLIWLKMRCFTYNLETHLPTDIT